MGVRRTVVGGLVLAVALSRLAVPATAASTIGLYTDETGSSCSFSGNTAGLMTAYVVVKPDQYGITGVRFSAVAPPCLGATLISESAPPGALVIGNSQTGISVAFPACMPASGYVLQLLYMRNSTSPCCEFTIAPDPGFATIQGTTCGFETVSLTPVHSHFNADVSCSCDDLTPPLPPTMPSPIDGLTTVSVFTNLAWQPSIYDTDIASYDLYLGTTPSPGLAATVGTPAYTPPQPLQELTQYYWRVVIRDRDGHTTTGPLWSFKTRAVNSPPSTPIAIWPVDAASGVAVTLQLQWTCSDVDGDPLTFDVYLGIAPDEQLVAANTSNTTHTISVPPLAYSTTYKWHVVARDSHGLTTTGPTWTFDTRPSNYPPQPASSPTPANNAINISTTIVLRWTSYDPDNQALKYDVYFGTSSPPPLAAANVSSSSYQPSLLAASTAYYWQIVARDPLGAEATGPIWKFTTGGPNHPPLAPSSPTPADLATGLPTSLTLFWQCSDPDGDALTYDVYFGTVPSPPLYRNGILVPRFNPPMLQFATTYYWKISAHDPSGLETEGPVWRFLTGSNSPPNAPSNPSPGNGAVTQLQQLTLSWAASDPDPGQTLHYNVYFGEQSPPPLAYSNLASPQANTGVLAPSTTYHWKVVAIDNFNASTASAEWTFTTGAFVNNPPNAPSNVSPGNGAVAQPLQLYLSWACTDPDPGQTLHYEVYFGTQSPPPLAFSNISNQYVSTAVLASSTTYHWKVVAFDNFNASTAGPEWTFTTGSSAISNPDPPDRRPIYSTSYTLQWSAAGDYSGFAVYLGTSLPPPLAGFSSSRSFNVTNLQWGQAYYWYVQALNGGAGVTGPLWSFTVGGGEVPVLFSRFQAEASGAAARISWELESDEAVSSYTLYRSAHGGKSPVAVATGQAVGTRGSYMDRDVEPGKTYDYEMVVRTTNGDEFRSQRATVEMPALDLTLGQNQPNPFNPQTTIPYTLPMGGGPVHVRLVVYDTSGRMVRVLVDEDRGGGASQVVWNGADENGAPVSSGVYYCVLQAGKERRTQKMVLLK